MAFDYSKPFKISGQDIGTNLVPNLLPPSSYEPDPVDRVVDAAQRGYKFYRQSDLIRKGVTSESAKEISRLQREIDDIPQSPELQRFQQAEGWGESIKAIADAPLETISQLLAESLGSLVPQSLKTIPAHMLTGAVAGFTIGGPPGAAIGARAGMISGTGVTSYSLEYAGKILESLREHGVDVRDPEQLSVAFSTPEIIDDIKEKAVRKGVPIAAFDALSAGVAGRFLGKPAASLAGRIGQTAAEVGQQMALSGAGEVAGEVSAGEKISPPSILAEMLLEPVAGGPEIVTGVIGRKTRPIDQPTRRPYATQERQEQVSVQPQRVEVTPGRPEPVPITGDIVQPGTPPEAQAPIDTSNFIVSVQAPSGEVPGNIQIIDRTQTETSQSPTVESLRAAGLPVPDFSTLPQGQYPYAQAIQILQGGQRSPQQVPVREGAGTIPAAPPAIPTSTSVSFWNQIDTSTEPQTISRPKIDSLVAEFREAYPNAPRIIVAENKRDLEVLTGGKFPLNDPVGAIVRSPAAGNTVFLVADKMTSGDRLKAILAHETIGHHGVEAVMGGEFRALALAVEQQLRGTEQWQDVSNRYGGRGGTFGTDDQAVFGSELLARMAEGNIEDLSLWEKIVAFIRKWWRDHVSRTNPISDAEIRKALVDARKFLQGQRAGSQTETGVAFAEEEQAQSEESPFDRMRRESGSEPPPELSQEEAAAKERNERKRGIRPNPRISYAFGPEHGLAAENGDEFWGVPTKVRDTEDLVRDRVRMTPESTAESQRHAERVFKEAGIEVTWLEHTPATENQPSKGIWRYVQKNNHEGGRKLVALLNRELAKNNAPLVGSLLNSVRYNSKLGNDQAVFDAPTRMALYIAAQAEASHRGLALGELSQHPATLPDIARNVDVVLNRIYHDAFGGEVIDEAMDKLRRGIQTFFSKPFIQQILAANPQLNESIEMINALGLGNQVPDAAQLIYEVFQTPFYKISDLAEMFRNKLVKDYGMDEGEAKKAGKRFQEAFDKHLKQAADEALKIATANLTYKKKVAVKSRKTVEQLLKDAIKKGQLDSGDVLREIAKENWGSTPSDADIAEMKRLANKHDELAALTPVEEAEVRKLEGDTAEAVERARQIKEAGNQPVRVAIQKKMEVAWARMKKPINNPLINPVLWWRTRGNFAMAVNEFIAANILAKVSFATRQLVAIFSQWISYVPSRGIADALVNYQHARVNGQQSALPKEMASALRDGYKQQFGALLPALSAMRSALFGRAESRNVGQLMSDMATLERLTKNAEEHWNKANELMAAGNVAGASAEFSKASLFYFISMTKMGYRVAQGLDRLQGIPVHYQNMSQQVMRALRDAGKTVAEAETSRDFVIGDIKQQWLLAIPIAKNYLEQSGEKFSTQDIKNAAWNIVKRWQYQRIAQLGLKADQFEEENNYLENTVGWNQRETRGLGGAAATSMRKVEQVAEGWGIPLVVTRFANAIGISINQSLMHTPLWLQANMGSGPESAWFKSETDRMQQRVKAAVGSALGSVAIGLVMSGYLVVRLKWPRDKEERDLWEREGHRPNTVEWKISDTEFIPFSLNNSPFMFVAPYLAAGGALRDAFDEQTKAQAKLDEEALKAGLPAGKAPGPGPADLFLIAAESAKQVVLGGRTAAGLIGSVSSYGTPNAVKTTGSYVSALIPFAPAAQDISRMAGVRMDEKMASVWDFILPLPGSEARKVNMLGDPVSTPDDIQRVLQIMTGGTYPGVVDSGAARQESGYQALFASGFRPPSISPGKGYEINGVFRPMNESELAKYTMARGEYFKQALSGFGAAATMEEVRAAFQDANQRALRDIGAAIPATSQTQSRTTTTTRPTSFRRPRRSRYGSGLRRGRSPRLRSGRRIRALRRSPVRPQRRTRLLAA